MAAELLGGKPYTCPTLTPAKGKEKVKIEKNKAYLFDILKANQIFDFLVKDRYIKFFERHKLPPTDQIQNLKYYKWHNSYSHYINNCTIFCNVIQKALKEGRFKLGDKTRASMTIDTNPFSTATINIVSISVKNKCAEKETSSIQCTKQVWTPKLVVVKENAKAQSHEGSRKNERKEWRPRPERRIETRGDMSHLNEVCSKDYRFLSRRINLEGKGLS